MASQDRTNKIVLFGGIAALIIFLLFIFMINRWLKNSLKEMQVPAPAASVAQVPLAPRQGNPVAQMGKFMPTAQKISVKDTNSRKVSKINEPAILDKVLNE